MEIIKQNKKQEQLDELFVQCIKENIDHRANQYDIKLAEIKSLLETGADIHICDDFALIHSLRYENNETAKLLLESGANANANNGETIFWAACGGNVEIGKSLLEHGANLNSDKWLNPINAAISNGHIEMTRFLLEQGADISKNSAAFKIAKEKGHILIFKLLEQYKSKDKLEIVKPETVKPEIITKQDISKKYNEKDFFKLYKEYIKAAGVVIVFALFLSTQMRLVNLERELMVVKLTQLTNPYQNKQ